MRQLHRDGPSKVRQPSKVASKGGWPRHKAVQENKAAKDTEDPLVKLERAVGLLDRSLLSVREYELLKQHILTDLLSTELGWSAAAQDKGRGVGRTLEDAGSFTARGWGRSAPEVGTGRVRVVCGLTPASVLYAKSQTLEPTAAVEPAQHGAKAASKMNKHPQVQGGSPQVASSSEMSPLITAAVREACGGAAHRGGERAADGKTTTMVGVVATASPPARGRARGGMAVRSTTHTPSKWDSGRTSSGWGRGRQELAMTQSKQGGSGSHPQQTGMRRRLDSPTPLHSSTPFCADRSRLELMIAGSQKFYVGPVHADTPNYADTRHGVSEEMMMMSFICSCRNQK